MRQLMPTWPSVLRWQAEAAQAALADVPVGVVVMQTHLSLFSCVHWLKHLHVVDELVKLVEINQLKVSRGEVDNPVCCWKKALSDSPANFTTSDCGTFW